MKYMFVKFTRDIRKLWAQFFSVFVMAMISLTIFAGMSAVWNAMGESADTYFKESNLADYWIYGMDISEENIAKIRELSYVEDVQASMCLTVDSEGKKEETDIKLTTFDEKTKEVLNPVCMDGEPVNADLEGIWIDEDYAAENKLECGDEITISYGGVQADVEVLGKVLHAENIYFITSGTESISNHEKHGYGYLSKEYATKIFGQHTNQQLRIRLSETIEKEEFQEDAKEILGNTFLTLFEREDIASVWSIYDEQEQIQKMAILFSVIFILLSLLTMYTTMSRLVNNQIVQIGTMKALGFSDRSIYGHYAMFGLFIGILGGAVGTVLGLKVVSPMLLEVKKLTLTVPEWTIAVSKEAIVVWVGIVFICAGASIITARKVIKGVPAQTIRGILEKKNVSKKELRPSKLSYEWLWNVRSIKQNPARYLMGIVAVLGSIVLMVAGIGIMDSMQYSYDLVYEEELCYDYAGTVRTGMHESVKEELSEGNVQYVQNEAANLEKGDRSQKGSVVILSKGDYIRMLEADTDEPLELSEGEVFLTGKMASMLGVSEGDEITYKLDNENEERTAKIHKIIALKMPQGIYMSEETWSEEFVPNLVYMDKNAYDHGKNAEGLNGIVTIEQQHEDTDTIMDSTRAIANILIVAAFVLSAVILYNLGTLNFIEKYREYATMKVLGFYRKELRSMVLKDSLLTLVFGVAFGIPASIGFLKIYVNTVSMENVEWVAHITTPKFVLVVLVVIAFSIAINLLVCRKINKVNMVEALKAND